MKLRMKELMLIFLVIGSIFFIVQPVSAGYSTIQIGGTGSPSCGPYSMFEYDYPECVAMANAWLGGTPGSVYWTWYIPDMPEYNCYFKTTYTSPPPPPPNTAPVSNVDSASCPTFIYPGKEFTFTTTATDADGQGDMSGGTCYAGIGDANNDIRVYFTAGTGTRSDTTQYGSGYLISWSVSGASITNGYRFTHTVVVDWDWDHDESTVIDFFALCHDGTEYSAWDTENDNVGFENDLEVVSYSITTNAANELGGDDGSIEEDDYFVYGSEVTIAGSIEYEGSSQTFDSTYAAAVDVELLFDGSDTNEIDASLSSGSFSGISYTIPSSTTEVPDATDFDMKINDIPTGGSDVTSSTMEVTATRDSMGGLTNLLDENPGFEDGENYWIISDSEAIDVDNSYNGDKSAIIEDGGYICSMATGMSDYFQADDASAVIVFYAKKMPAVSNGTTDIRVKIWQEHTLPSTYATWEFEDIGFEWQVYVIYTDTMTPDWYSTEEKPWYEDQNHIMFYANTLGGVNSVIIDQVFIGYLG